MTTSIRLILMASLGLLLASSPADAKPRAANGEAASSTSDKVDISAQNSLEWYRDKRLYVARGEAKAISGTMTIEADILTAKEREPQDKKTTASNSGGNIAYMTAEGHVKISDPNQQVFGDKAVYDMDTKSVKVTGTDLKYITANNVVTAKESLEYFEDKTMAVAKGHAIADHQGDRIQADMLTAYFVRTPAGQSELDHMQARGNVIVVTKDGAVSRGEKGYYDAKKNTAYLMEHVRITQGETQLAGDKAEVNFGTGESRLLNDGSGRVRALLPSSGHKKTDK